MNPKILSIDIETAPILGSVWQLWNNFLSIDQINEDWYILCYAAKWLGEKDVIANSLFNNPARYAADPQDDRQLMNELHALLDEADIVVAHNGARFDIPKMNAQFLRYGMNPPAPYQQVDTLRVAKKNFRLTSNKLDYIARLFGIGGKNKTDFTLWADCGKGCPKAWKYMLDYNIQDTVLLEKVYVRLLPWITTHPNLGLYGDGEAPVCPKCGGRHIQWRGYYYTNMNKYHRFQCKSCGGWGRARLTAVDKEHRRNLLTNVPL